MQQDKTEIFERMAIPRAVATLAVPTILSSLVTVLYNLADTYFVALLGDPVQNAAVTLAAPVMLAFNAINNLFGVGSSSMMSRALGRKDYERVEKGSTFGIWCAIFCGLIFSIGCTIFKGPLLSLLGADATTSAATDAYMFWTVNVGAAPAILNVVMAQLVRAEGSALHASIGTMSGCLLNIVLDPIFVLPWGLDMGAAGRDWPPSSPTVWPVGTSLCCSPSGGGAPMSAAISANSALSPPSSGRCAWWGSLPRSRTCSMSPA